MTKRSSLTRTDDGRESLPDRTAGRRLFLAQLLVLTAGCHAITPPSLPKLPFIDKKEESDSLFTVDGVVTKIRTTSDWRFMAVLHQKKPFEDGGESPAEDAFFQSGCLNLYDMEFQTPVPVPDANLESIVNPFAVAFDRKGRHCFIAHGTRFRRFDRSGLSCPIAVEKVTLTRRPIQTDQIVREDERWADAVLSPRGDWLGIQNDEGIWKLIDLTETKKEVVFPEVRETEDGEKKTIVSRILTFSSDGTLVAVLLAPTDEDPITRNQTIAIWDLSVARQIPLDKAKKLPLSALYISEFRIRDTAAGQIASFSPDGQMIAVRNKQNYVGVWQTAGGRMLSEFGEHRQPVTALKFSPNNTKLAVGTGAERGRLVLWDVRKGTILRTYDDPDKKGRKVTAIEFSPDGDLIYFGNERGGVKQWEYQARKLKKKDAGNED